MSIRVVITGRGVVTPVGHSPRALHRALCEGRSAIRPIEGFDTQGLPCNEGGEIAAFRPQDFLGKRNLRPLDRTSQLLAVAAQLALVDSGTCPLTREREDVGLVVGTMFCSVRTIAAFDRRAMAAGPAYASPLDFANTVINAAAGQIAILHGLRGVNSTIAAGCTSGLRAITYAADLVRSGRACIVLAGGVDELCFESLYGFYRTGQLRELRNGSRSCPVPFDARRKGFCLAEGAALLMLESADSALRRGVPILGEITGYGHAFDGSLRENSAQSVAAIERSMRQALQNAGVTPAQLDAWSSSANGSIREDRHEAWAAARVLGGQEREVPITASKSVLGETLGASGALQVVALLEAMREGELPGISGLKELEPDFPLKGVSSRKRRVDLRTGLVSSVSYEGHATSMVLRRPKGLFDQHRGGTNDNS